MIPQVSTLEASLALSYGTCSVWCFLETVAGGLCVVSAITYRYKILVFLSFFTSKFIEQLVQPSRTHSDREAAIMKAK